MNLSAQPVNIPTDTQAWPIVLVDALPLAQGQAPSGNVFGLIVLLGVVILLGVAAVVFARKFSSQFSGDYRGRIFTLQELREMHRAGKLTDQEFDKAKKLVVSAELDGSELRSRRKDASDDTGELQFDDMDFEIEDNQLRGDPAHRVVKANPGPRRRDTSRPIPPPKPAEEGNATGSTGDAPKADQDDADPDPEATTDAPPKRSS